ncbi:autophagy-related protein 13 homolog isoform X2 [Atheta coriaria]|uniref:autophagy-related protein 13 homolog isoform X2 n=1 Tax=Dalotia coriaria TaxID=877792 RepID=UPI0031F457CE
MQLMEMRLSSQDRKDLDKFTKFLAFKSAQVIVQSRLGEKKSTKCNPQQSGADWFNLAIEDLPEVLTETKKALNGEVVTNCLPLCVEISLKTVEGDQMVLESWCLDILPEQCDPAVRVTHTVYNRMGILLKSLVSVTRVTPAYKLSRRQGPDSYVICYRIYMDEPQMHNLGDGYKQVRVGQICTPIGTIQLTVSYRTKMTISPTQSGREDSIMLKSDHFNTNCSPRNMRYKQNEENIASLGNTRKIGAFAANGNKQNSKQYPMPDFIIPEIPYTKLFEDQLKLKVDEEEKELENNEEQPADINDSTTTIKPDEDKNGNSTDSIDSSPPSQTRNRFTMMSTLKDDFIMKTPFASSTANSELGEIYREWKEAPPLQTFNDMPPLVDQVPDLTQQLENYESDMRTYEDVLQSLCQSPNNN